MKNREAFDIGVIVSDKKIKGVWNYNKVKTYEVQTTAIKSEVDRCIEKSKEHNNELIFATNSNKVKSEIESMTMDGYKVVKISPYPEINQNTQAALGQNP